MIFTVAAGGAPIDLGLSPGVSLALGLFLVALNAFFVAAEFALAKVRPTQIEPFVQRGDRRGKLASEMLKHLDAYLSATQLGITLASIALGWVGEPAFSWMIRPLVDLVPGLEQHSHSWSMASSFVIVSVLHIVFGELIPKSIAIRLPDATSIWIAVPLWAFYRVAYPAIWLLNKTANGALRIVGIEPASESELGHTEEELRLLLAAHQGSQLPEQKRSLLAGVFELSDRIARQILVPRGDVVYLSTTRSYEENVALVRQSSHTRFPLCEGDLDQIIGLVHIKDLFLAPAATADLRALARPVKFVPETISVDKLLARMRSERVHLMAVLDEYGGVSGIVTMENVIEEIVGQIQDEFDTERPELVRKDDHHFIVSGSMLVVDLEDELKIEFSDRDEDTVGGIVLSELGRRPVQGDRVRVGNLIFEVAEVQRNRIQTLSLEVVPEQRGDDTTP